MKHISSASSHNQIISVKMEAECPVRDIPTIILIILTMSRVPSFGLVVGKGVGVVLT